MILSQKGNEHGKTNIVSGANSAHLLPLRYYLVSHPLVAPAYSHSDIGETDYQKIISSKTKYYSPVMTAKFRKWLN